MDINIEFLDGLTAADLDAIALGQKLLAEARRDVKAFLENCLFHANESQLKVSADDPSIKEYVLYTGVWQRWVNNELYELPITTEDVFEAYKAAYMTDSQQKVKENVAAFRSRARLLLQEAAWKSRTEQNTNAD